MHYPHFKWQLGEIICISFWNTLKFRLSGEFTIKDYWYVTCIYSEVEQTPNILVQHGHVSLVNKSLVRVSTIESIAARASVIFFYPQHIWLACVTDFSPCQKAKEINSKVSDLFCSSISKLPRVEGVQSMLIFFYIFSLMQHMSWLLHPLILGAHVCWNRSSEIFSEHCRAAHKQGGVLRWSSTIVHLCTYRLCTIFWPNKDISANKMKKNTLISLIFVLMFLSEAYSVQVLIHISLWWFFCAF